MTVCNGAGDRGGHCCTIAGQTCQFLTAEVRCGKWDTMGDREWTEAPVGQWFASVHPGYTCHDWPQNIPYVMEQAETAGPFFACCWGRGNA